MQYLDIVNHRGRPNIPLHVGFVGGNTVLSDGCTTSTLCLRITKLSLGKDLRLQKDSMFRISCDVQKEGEVYEWALLAAGAAPSAHLKLSKAQQENWVVSDSSLLGESLEWTVSPQLNEDESLKKENLKAGEALVLDLTVIALAIVGHANIYVTMENIPEYQDQQMIAVVKKAPLLYSDNKVGIGTPAPGDYKLSIKGGDTYLENSLHLEKKQEIFFADNGQIRSCDDCHRILFRRDENKMELREYGDLVFSPGATAGQETARMVVQANGKVGINLNKQKSTETLLEVNGNVDVAGSLRLAKNQGIFFADNGQIRSGDDCHRILFRREEDKMELREYGDLVFSPGAIDGKGTNKAVILANGNMGVGGGSDTPPQAKLHIVNKNQNADANSNTFILGPTNQSNLRLGYDESYSWIQSHGSKPLAINPVGNNVGIGTTNPGDYKLNVNGNIKAEDISSNKLNVTGETVTQDLHVKGDMQMADITYFSAQDKPESSKSPHCGAFRFGDGTSWRIHFGRQLKSEEKQNSDLNVSDPGRGQGAALTIVDNGTVIVGDRLYVKGDLNYYSGGQWRRLGGSDVWKKAATCETTSGPSDIRLKTALHPISDALEKVLQLNGTYFPLERNGP